MMESTASERRPSFSAFFLGAQRTSTCRFTSSPFIPLSSQERGPGGYRNTSTGFARTEWTT